MSDINAELAAFLPGAVEAASTDLSGSVIWLYGDMKVGKTTFASKFPGVWFVATEDGQKFVDCRKPTRVTSWVGFQRFVDLLTKHKPTHFADGEPIQWLALDVYDDLYRMCYQHVSTSLGVEDPSELPHGKGWGRLRNTFFTTMRQLRACGYGLILISHFKTSTFENAGQKRNRYEPNVGAAGMDWAKKEADLIAFARVLQVPEKDAEGTVTGRILEKRVMHCHPTPELVAGGRFMRYIPKLVDLSSDVILKYFTNQELTEDEISSSEVEQAPVSTTGGDEAADN